MALVGTLSTMPLPDLLQWLGGGGKTGKLRVERNKIGKWILFRDGRVVASWSNEPRELLGQFLVSRGKIDEKTLRAALAVKENSEQQLGEILVSMDVIDQEELTRNLTAKAEETIFSLFDWEQAVFRFLDEDVDESTIAFPIDLRVEDVLLRGMQRLDESRRIRTVFNDPGIVLRHTDRPPPGTVLGNSMARGIYESINGERTVAEILLHSHASEYLVTKFLFELFRSGIVEIARVRVLVGVETDASGKVIDLDAAKRRTGDRGTDPGKDRVPASPPETPAAAPAVNEATGPSEPPGRELPAPEPEIETPIPTPGPAAAPAVASEPEVAARIEPPDPETSLREDLAVAGRLMSRGEFEMALQILDTNYKAHPEDDALRRLLAEAEAAFLEKTYRYHLPREKLLQLLKPVEEMEGERLSPEEFFLLSRIDGTWDVKSIIQISPIREIDALRTLKRMIEKGVIELLDSDRVS
jgi:hypothetical protein